MSQKDLVGQLVKLKSGRLGMVLSVEISGGQTYLVVLVSDIGMIHINVKDVEIIKG